MSLAIPAKSETKGAMIARDFSDAMERMRNPGVAEWRQMMAFSFRQTAVMVAKQKATRRQNAAALPGTSVFFPEHLDLFRRGLIAQRAYRRKLRAMIAAASAVSLPLAAE